MCISRRKSFSLLVFSLSIALLQISPSALGAVSLAEKYSVESKQECQGTIAGDLTLDFPRHVYSYTANNTGDMVESGDASDGFEFTCGGQFDFKGSLEKWGSGSIQDNGTVVFECVVLTPKPQIRIWPFSCDW
jgi:hypothetical protein